MAPLRWGLALLLLLATACSGTAGGIAPSVPGALATTAAPSWIAIQFVDDAGVVLFPTHSKGGNCWPIDSPPKPLPANLPTKAYHVISLLYASWVCGDVSTTSFSVKYGKQNPPGPGCTIEISYNGNLKQPYIFDERRGGGLSCYEQAYENKGTPPVTIYAFHIK